MTDTEIALLEKERELNADLDARLAKNPNAVPRAIYYILPNEFGERFTFYGTKALLTRYVIALTLKSSKMLRGSFFSLNIDWMVCRYLNYIGTTKEHAKLLVHAWSMVRGFPFPKLEKKTFIRYFRL